MVNYVHQSIESIIAGYYYMKIQQAKRQFLKNNVRL